MLTLIEANTNILSYNTSNMKTQDIFKIDLNFIHS